VSEKISQRNRFIQTSLTDQTMTWYYDAHIHLSDPFYAPELGFIISQMEHIKLKACCVSTNISDSKNTLKLAPYNKLIIPFIGIHPENANDALEYMTNMIDQNHEFIGGVGEIGLDPTYIKCADDAKRQKHVFETLLSLAEKYQKPVSIHSRNSLDDILQIMTSYNTKNALLHWFDGSKKQLQKAMDMDFFVSYGPVMIYANDKQTLLSNTEKSKILVETDGPVKFSRCFEMKPAQITFIPSVIFSASKILGISFDEMTSLLDANSKSFLGI